MTALPALARMACVWMDYAPLHVTVLGQTSMETCAKIVSIDAYGLLQLG